MKFKVMVNFLL